MRVLLVSSSSGSRGGGEIFLLYLGEALRTSGHTVALWAARHPRMEELAQRFSAFGEVLRDDYTNTYDHWHRGLLTRGRRSAESLAERWLAWRPDVIHLNKQNLEDGNDLLAALAGLPVPNLCTIHITQSARFLGARFAGWRDARARRALCAYARLLVAVAPTRQKELTDFLDDAAPTRLVLNGVPPGANPASSRLELRARESLADEMFAIVAVGRLEPQKCPLRFLHHAARIRAQLPAARLRWIGSGRMTAEWEREVAARQLQSTVTRIDWRNDVRAALPAYDLFLHTAAFEGLPLALLEAMDAGLPCAVERAVHAQLPSSLQSCALVVGDDTDWGRLLGDRARLAALGARAQTIVRAEFSTSAMARAYESIYTELCGKN